MTDMTELSPSSIENLIPQILSEVISGMGLAECCYAKGFQSPHNLFPHLWLQHAHYVQLDLVVASFPGLPSFFRTRLVRAALDPC